MATVERVLCVCRYDAMVAPVIHAVQTLLPTNICHIRKPGTDDDYVLAFTDVDKLHPTDIRKVATWLEQQICGMIMTAADEVTSCPYIQMTVFSQCVNSLLSCIRPMQ